MEFIFTCTITLINFTNDLPPINFIFRPSVSGMQKELFINYVVLNWKMVFDAKDFTPIAQPMCRTWTKDIVTGPNRAYEKLHEIDVLRSSN